MPKKILVLAAAALAAAGIACAQHPVMRLRGLNGKAEIV